MSIEKKKKTKQNLQAGENLELSVRCQKNINISCGSTHALANSIGQGEAQHLGSNATTVVGYSRF